MTLQTIESLDPGITGEDREAQPLSPSAGAPQAGAPVRTDREALRVLVVESEPRAAQSLVQGLRRHGYLADSVATGAKALHAHHSADLVLLDLDLPDLDGLEVCRSIRSSCETPVIAITARDTELDRVLGLQAGADDYMSKPYGFRELLARIQAIMRRVRPREPQERIIVRGPLRIDLDNWEVRLDGKPVELTRKEFGLLRMLASRPNSVVSRRQLMAQVWDDSWSRPGRTIDTHVSSLRNKLGSSSWIITVRGVGFRLGHP
ncbi:MULTISPECIES: response regulator transcription factor [Streptomyces]|uniref:Sensory transduction protein RegX3 n=1 Tax=Streptomyces pini TaxID=1520580 RepID=A0A1I4IEW2_9ACTN|nr:response regulator transcription factor [Streptomyces pini]SFL52597.1 DNA-binding response regulator, OmpR family, contains REC and winged-helix (wHTH) domain [Streptomyces pini]